MTNATLNQFCLWLGDTQFSQLIMSSGWLVPSAQIIHIFAVSAALSVLLMIALRLLGYFASEQPFSSTFDRCWPIFRISLLVLLGSGLILIIVEPSRALANTSFQIKMILLVVVLLNLQFIKKRLVNPLTDWRSGYGPERVIQTQGRILSITLLLLLICVVIAGRMIAYT